MPDDIKTLFSKWVNKFSTQNNDPTEDSPDNLPDSEFNGTDQYKLSNADYQNLEDIKKAVAEGALVEGISFDELFSAAGKVEHVNNQRAGILKASDGTTRTADFTSTNNYKGGYLTDLNSQSQSGAGIPDENGAYAIEQRDGILRSNIETRTSEFNNNIEYGLSNADYQNLEDIKKAAAEGTAVQGISFDELFSAADKVEHVNNQRAGILKTSGSTERTAEFNISRQYNKDNGDLEFLANTEQTEENISNVVGNASGFLDKLFKLNDNVTYLTDQQAGVLKTSDGTTRTADFSSTSDYQGGYLSNLNSLVDEGLAMSSNASYAEDQREGILRANGETRTSEFNNNIEYGLSNADYQNLEDIKKAVAEGTAVEGISFDELFSAVSKIEHVNNQRAGILKTSGSTERTAEFNISRQYNKDNGDLEFLANTEQTEENVINVVGNAAGFFDKLFKLNDNITYLADQQAGILKASDGTTRTADFTSITVYEGGYLSNLNNLVDEGFAMSSDANYAKDQREGILRSNTETRISEFNSDDAYPSLKNEDGSFVDRDTEKQRVDLLNNWNSNERPSLSRGNTYGNSIQYQQLSNPYEKIEIDLGTLFEGAPAIEVYDNNISRRFLQKLTNTATNGFNSSDSFKDFDDFFNQVDEVTASGIFVGDDNNIKDILRRWIENFDNLSSSDLTSDRVGGNPYVNDTNNRESFFSDSNEYIRTDSYYNESGTNTINASRDSHLDSNDITRGNQIIQANQLGYGTSLTTNGDTTSVTQFFNSEREYGSNTVSSELDLDNLVFTQSGEDLIIAAGEERKTLRTLLSRWTTKSQDILGGRKLETSNGNDHYSDWRTLPNTNISADNIYSGTDYGPLDYILNYFQGLQEWTSRPDETQLADMAASGFTVGQILGSNSFTRRSLTGTTINNIPTRLLDYLSTYGLDTTNDVSADDIESKKLEIVDSYLPGLDRPNQPVRIAAALSDYLEQNLLLPVEDSAVLGSVQNVWNSLYLNNRSSVAASFLVEKARENGAVINNISVFDDGVMGGVPLQEIERSGSKSDGSLVPKVFSFTSEKTYESKINGFNNNIPGSVEGVGADGNDTADIGTELPAVVTMPNRSYQERVANRQQKGDEQYFPFLFETENRTTSNQQNFEQMCYLQATLDSINESFNPAWQQKHFFGRTEQISTYTYTERTIDLSFSVIANTIRQLQNLHERVSWLAQQTYGQYNLNQVNQATKLGAGPLIKMTIGDMFVGVGGYIQSLNYDWNFLGAGGKWEVTEGLRIPMGCKVSMSFKVLHDDLPDRNYSLYSGPLQRDDGLIRTQPSAGQGEDGELLPLIPVYGRSVQTTGLGGQLQNEQYIDYLARNTSVGNTTIVQ